MNEDSFVDWTDVHRKIAGSENPEGPLEAIRLGSQSGGEEDPFERIDSRLDGLIEELRLSFERLTK